MIREGILFVVSGSSGVGKGTINSALLAQVKDIRPSVSVTTRPMRAGEIEGQDYFFVSPEEFAASIDNDEFLEYAHVYSHFYGTPKKFVIETLQKGYDVLLEIDIQGALKVKEKIPEAVLIFIQPPSMEILTQRIHDRGQDSLHSIQTRLAASEEEMNMVKYYDYAVVNDDLDEAVYRVQAIIVAERCRVKKLLRSDCFDSTFNPGPDQHRTKQICSSSRRRPAGSLFIRKKEE
jgi:guanylate kinase